MFTSLFTSSKNKNKQNDASEWEIVNITRRKDIESKLNELCEKPVENSHNSGFIDNHDIIDALEVMSIGDTNVDDDTDSVDNFGDSQSEISSIGEVTPTLQDGNSDKIKTINRINSVQCLFTWGLKPNNRKNIILMIQNKYGEYNLDISLPEFTFQRFVGNLIIAYELFHKDETELGQMKVLEIGKWLEELDKLKVDEFYLSINIALKHVMTGTLIHMLFATNLTGECNWLLESITPLATMDTKSRATVFALRAAVQYEYGGNSNFLKNTSKYAKKACDLDPNTSHWFYIYSLTLTAHRQFLQTRKSKPAENEINSIQQAILLSDGKNNLFHYQRMILDRDTAIHYYHENKNKKDKSIFQKNVQEHKVIVQMIKTIISTEPKDPILIINCAKTIMTLPVMVRNFNLGKQYLIKALKIAPNDKAVLEAVEKTIQTYQEVSKKNHTQSEKEPCQPELKSKIPNLTEDLRNLVWKHKNGENLVPHLTKLTAKYDGMDQCKLMAQFCSYNILFSNNLKKGIEQFVWLTEQPGMVNNNLITQHFSSFGTKKFNLAELICNEIRLVNASVTPSEDMLFYYQMLAKIMETYNLKIREVDSSMKTKLIVKLSDKATNPTKTQQKKTDSLDHENIDKKENITKNSKKTQSSPKPCKTTDSKTVNRKSDWKKRSNLNTPKNVQNKTHQTNANDLDEMTFKMNKFLSTAEARSNNFNPLPPLLPDNIRNIQTQADIDHYTQQLYENILNRRQQQQNNFSPSYLNSFLNQTNMNPSNAQRPPSLLSLRPQISPETLQKKQTKINNIKKKK